jgi:hypothetical protein
LRRIDTARETDCNQRITVALKSKINPAVGRSYDYGDSVWFKLNSSHKWKSGQVLGQDGNVLFIKYEHFLRRVPLDHVVQAKEFVEDDGIEIDQNDVENQERLIDDSFENVDIVAQKDMKIEQLKRINEDQLKIIKQLENDAIRKSGNISSSRMETECKPSVTAKIVSKDKI